MLIGSDPEFLILNRDNVVSAKEFFNFEVDCGDCCHEECVGDCDDYGIYSAIGHDTEELIGELRPHQEKLPEDHCKNIKELIKLIDVPKNYKLIAGTTYDDYTLGGHIHFGMNIYPDNVQYFSNYLSFYAGIPLKKIECPEDLYYRGLHPDKYGFFGTFNYKHYGIEWRMPASWLISSKIALAALSLSYVVAQEYFKRPEKIVMNNEYYISLLEDGGSISFILAKLETMKLYDSYSKEIKPIIKMIENKKHWDSTVNMKDGW